MFSFFAAKTQRRRLQLETFDQWTERPGSDLITENRDADFSIGFAQSVNYNLKSLIHSI